MTSKVEVASRVALFLLGLAAWPLAVLLALFGTWESAAAAAVFAFAAALAGRAWSRAHPIPLPSCLRWILLLPRGPHSPHRIAMLLEPRPGERILEVGPGVGVHAIPLARALQPLGILDALDAQQPMLDELARRAARQGVGNIVATRGYAGTLPHANCSFDAAYLVGVLGELPDPAQALRELARVLKPGGRLLVAELLIDPDYVSFSRLRRMAEKAGFALTRRIGPFLAYVAIFRSDVPQPF